MGNSRLIFFIFLKQCSLAGNLSHFGHYFCDFTGFQVQVLGFQIMNRFGLAENIKSTNILFQRQCLPTTLHDPDEQEKLHQISRTILTAHNPTWWRRMMDGRVGQTLCQVIRRDHFEVTSVVCYWIFHVDNAYIPPFPPFLWTDFVVSLQTVVLSNLWFCKWLRALYLGPLWKHPGCLP